MEEIFIITHRHIDGQLVVCYQGWHSTEARGAETAKKVDQELKQSV